jgi:uncharacterized NAD(P)/FAD-binding protein YdhS
MRSDRRAAVAIIGGGFSGTMVAAHLARMGIKSVVVESSGRAGMGAAFSTTEPVHLLNIRAAMMGAWADKPEDFAEREKLGSDVFAERRRFGRYLRSILDEAVTSGHATLVEDRAVSASSDGQSWRVELESGSAVEAEGVVLALGNQPPAPVPFAAEAGSRLVENPWGEQARAAIRDAAERDVDVLIVGTSLTMIDIALSLDLAGHRGRTLAVSRRGKLPLPGGSHEAAPVDWTDLPPPRIRDIAKWLRRRSATVNWRSVIDSLRPHSHRLWQSLPIDQKRLFLRRGRPWWDIHRHRIAPEIAERVDELIADGRLEVVAGRVVEAETASDGVEVTIRRRGSDVPEPPRKFGYIFNCTGPLHDIGRTGDPLLRQLQDDRLAEPDELGIGLRVDQRSRVQPSERLWALGTLTKGRYWEMIAVPDIREQAAAVAADIATELGQ